MREVVWKWAGALGLVAGLGFSLRAAEQAWRTDGRRVSGTLALEKGRLRLTPTQGEAIPLADLTRIRFAEGTPAPFRVGGGRRVHLRDGQRITGQFLGLNKDTLTMRTAWATRIELPRAAVHVIESLPGWRMVAADDFRDGLKAFTTAGEPALTKPGAGMEPRSVLLREDGQRLVYTPAKSLEAGRAGINFQEQGQASGARWTIELLFQEGDRPRRIAVAVAGEGENYAVEAGGLKGGARSVARTAGWHRLILTFSKRSMRVTCDDDVLWYNLEQGAGGPLKQVTIHCHKAAAERLRGAVAWTEFCLERAVQEHPRPPVEAEQDEALLTSEDQLFGRILQADRRAVQIEGRFGKRSLPWTEVAGCTFRRVPMPPPRPPESATVRLRVHSGLSPESDVLDGVVTALDERTLVLHHALLGDVKFERDRVRSLRPRGWR